MQPADLEALRRLVFQLHETLRPFDAHLPPAPQIIDAYFAHLLETSRRSSGAMLIAEEEGVPVGYLCLFGLVPPAEPDQYPDPYSVVADVYVVPEKRSRGIGKALMAHAEARARALGASKLELNVLAANRAAAEFYAQLGYRPRVVVYAKQL